MVVCVEVDGLGFLYFGLVIVLGCVIEWIIGVEDEYSGKW